MEEDLFKAAGIDLTEDNPRGRKKRKTTGGGNRGKSNRKQTALKDNEYDASFGGHNLRQVVGLRVRDGEQVTYRPRSRLATESAQRTLESVVETTTPKKATAANDADSEDDSSEGYYDPEEYDDEYDDDNDDDVDDDDDGNDEDIDTPECTNRVPAKSVAPATPTAPPKRTSSTAPTLRHHNHFLTPPWERSWSWVVQQQPYSQLPGIH